MLLLLLRVVTTPFVVVVVVDVIFIVGFRQSDVKRAFAIVTTKNKGAEIVIVSIITFLVFDENMTDGLMNERTD